jgi:DNA-binding PadR family transcriptional regulator
MEEKGYLSSWLEEGLHGSMGPPRRMYAITTRGLTARRMRQAAMAVEEEAGLAALNPIAALERA